MLKPGHMSNTQKLMDLVPGWFKNQNTDYRLEPSILSMRFVCWESW